MAHLINFFGVGIDLGGGVDAKMIDKSSFGGIGNIEMLILESMSRHRLSGFMM